MAKGNKKHQNKFYAVKKGLKPGIYNTWEECKIQVIKFPGAIYKSFKTLSEATEFMKEKNNNNNKNYNNDNNKNSNNNKNDKNNNENIKKSEAYAYVDGAFNKYKKIYGYGGFIIYKGEKYIIKGNGKDPNLVEMRNVAGEIKAAEETIKKAIELEIKSIDIFYDYEGIHRWATGDWKTNKYGTKKYFEFYQEIKSKINVNFIKVKAHSDEEGNDEADKIAKQSCFIYQRFQG